MQAEAKAHEEGEQATKIALKQQSKKEENRIETRIARAKMYRAMLERESLKFDLTVLFQGYAGAE